MFAHDQLLRKLWLDRMERGGFFFYQLRRAELDRDTRSTVAPAGQRPFCVQFNRHRGTEKRRGVAVTSVRMPFDSAQFNFLRVKLEEVLFILPPSAGATGAGAAAAGAMTAMVSLQGQSPHLVVINASPIEQMHVLFCPRTFDRLPQQLTPDAVEAALSFASLSRDLNLRMGFNSLGAAASVNHLHFHMYRLAAELPLEACETRALRSLQGGVFSELVGYPIPGFCFHFSAFDAPAAASGGGGGGGGGGSSSSSSSSSSEEAARGAAAAAAAARPLGRVGTELTLLQLLHRCVAALQAHEVAHNLCITHNGRNVFVFPRALALGVNQQGGLQDVGCMEMSGHFIAFDQRSFESATHARCADALAAVAAPVEMYEAIKRDTLAAVGYGTKLSML
jgi:hypothetical protein